MTSATRQRIAVGLLLAYVIFLAVTGLNPRDLSRGNEVRWLPDEPGIRFDGHGLAYTDAPAGGQPGAGFAAFTLLLDLRLAATQGRRGFEHVVTVFGDTTASQLLIGQWKDSLIVTNGADYDYRQRRPRLSATLAPDDGHWHLLAVTADDAGTRLYLDGEEVAAMVETLTLPAEDGDFHLLLGNSVHGNQGWRGSIRAVALLPRALDPAGIGEVSGRLEETSLDALGAGAPELLFVFGEGRGRRSADLGRRGLALSFPPDRVILEPEFFQPGFRDARLSDVVVNLFGFVPLGILGVLVLRGAERSRTLGPVIIPVLVVAGGIALSACIEIAQAWMPMRSSSLLDLLLNSAGTAVGALAGLLLARQLERLLVPAAQRES
ncbi:MAG: LamG-like jellyroll fold domain-containing protein [Pseudomonadales bacterium]